MGDGAETFGDAVHLQAEQHVGFDDVDFVAALDWYACGVAGGAVADRPRLGTAERVGVSA